MIKIDKYNECTRKYLWNHPLSRGLATLFIEKVKTCLQICQLCCYAWMANPTVTCFGYGFCYVTIHLLTSICQRSCWDKYLDCDIFGGMTRLSFRHDQPVPWDGTLPFGLVISRHHLPIYVDWIDQKQADVSSCRVIYVIAWGILLVNVLFNHTTISIFLGFDGNIINYDFMGPIFVAIKWSVDPSLGTFACFTSYPSDLCVLLTMSHISADDIMVAHLNILKKRKA